MELAVGIFRGSLGIAALIGICYLLSNNRKAIDWGLVIKGLLIQLGLALALLNIPFLRFFFKIVSDFFVQILKFTEAGATFLFAGLMDPSQSFGYVFAFQVLPTIVFFAAFSAVLYYLGILQRIIFGFAWLMKKVMGLSGSESLAAAANVFIGQTEAPLVVKPYLEKMTRSEMLCLMTGGMATIAGGVFAAYVGFLGESFAVLPDITGMDVEAGKAAIEAAKDASKNLFAQHLLLASIISAPAAIVAAKILYPQDEPEKVNQDFMVPKDKIGSNLLEAIAIGTTDGLKLAVNVGAMLLVFTALIAMLNYFLTDVIGYFTPLNGWVKEFALYLKGNGFQIQPSAMEGLNLEFILGCLFAPIAWLLGVPSTDIFLVGQLLGQKTAINEFFAYAELGKFTKVLQIKSLIISTYALCGFANFASIGIQIGGIGAIAPGQKTTVAEFGIKALIGGTVACFITAAIAGMIVSESSFLF
ncbi:MAG: NupC/NupG family nucleoside CNT transporter [Saprospiraceae bacterium]